MRSIMVWRGPAPAGAPPPRARTGLVWRDPVADGMRGEAMAAGGAASPPGRGADALVQSRQAPAPPPAVATPAPDVGRLVDEVVRRIERIGRDERLRRGL